MTSRNIINEGDRVLLVRLIEDRKLPFSVRIKDGRNRSIEQNKLQRLWMNEAAEQLGDRTAEECRGECKLRFGVPILRAENDDFRERYDRIIRPLPYETKLELMMEPMDFPVTRLMKVSQKTRYLDAVLRHFSEQGLVLTMPEPA